MDLTIDAWTVDVGMAAADAGAWMDLLACRVEESWQTGADLVLLPEYCWMGLEPFAAAQDANEVLSATARLFWNDLWPSLQSRLSLAGKGAVLGSVPWINPTSGKLFNRAPVVSDSSAIFQDKLCLTPWESQFAGGDTIEVWTFREWRIAVLICLDIEIPEHSALLRGVGLDALLVPSATETVLGTERIARCASARAVELGCHVVVAHLTGRTNSVIVDENVGRISCHSPSQSPFLEMQRCDEGEMHVAGFHRRRFVLSRRPLEVMRRMHAETNPAFCRPGRMGIAY